MVKWAKIVKFNQIIPYCILFENLDWSISTYLYFPKWKVHIFVRNPCTVLNFTITIIQFYTKKDGYFSSNQKTETLNVHILVEFENQMTKPFVPTFRSNNFNDLLDVLYV